MIKKTICYFGIYKPVAPRDKVYLDGLKRQGVTVIECVDTSFGFSKFFRICKKLLNIKETYDVLWVGYLSGMCVPFAWIFSRRKIIYNALDSWHERAILDRAEHGRFSVMALIIWLSDFLAFHLADVSLVDSESQQRFLSKKFFVSPSKLQVIFTGVDKDTFHSDPLIKERNKFSVIFRGMFLPATGVEYIIEAARILKDEPIDFVIVGWGPLQEKVKEMIKEHGLSNINLTTHFLPPESLRGLILSCHVMLGQFSDHSRMDHTIQNKTIEALALGMPYITRNSESNREILKDRENCLFVPPADSRALADAILLLKNDPILRGKLGEKAFLRYKGIFEAEQFLLPIEKFLEL